jgi:hypothetical protein
MSKRLWSTAACAVVLGFSLSACGEGGTSYDYATGIVTSSLEQMSLRPSGRELDAEFSYVSGLLDGNAWLGDNLFYRRQPGNIAAAPGDAGAALRFTLGF